MEEIVKRINEQATEFYQEAMKDVKGNKAAGLRARKLSLALEKDLLAFRKLSVEKNHA